MNISIDYPTLYATVARSLSIIGKRSTDDNGNLLFKDITLGTREQEIISDYFRQAVIDLAARTAAFITPSEEAEPAEAAVPAGSATASSITVTFPQNHNAELEPFVQSSCEAYCVSYALYSWLYITGPRIAPRYLEDSKRNLDEVLRLLQDAKAQKAPVYPYPTAIWINFPIPTRPGMSPAVNLDSNVTVDPMTLCSDPWTMHVGDDTEITYMLTGENGKRPVDDIVVRCDDACCQPFFSPDGHWKVRGIRRGCTVVTLFSRHDDRVFASFAIRIL